MMIFRKELKELLLVLFLSLLYAVLSVYCRVYWGDPNDYYSYYWGYTDFGYIVIPFACFFMKGNDAVRVSTYGAWLACIFTPEYSISLSIRILTNFLVSCAFVYFISGYLYWFFKYYDVLHNDCSGVGVFIGYFHAVTFIVVTVNAGIAIERMAEIHRFDLNVINADANTE